MRRSALPFRLSVSGAVAFIFTFGVAAVGLLAWRLAWLAFGAKRLPYRVLVLGAGPAASVLPELQLSRARPFTIVGFVDDALDAADRVPPGFELLNKTADLLNLADELRPDLVLVDLRQTLPALSLVECRLKGINVEDWPTFYEKQTGKILVTNLRPSWLIFSGGFAKTNTMRMVKRAMDIALAFIGLYLSLPVMVVVACAIKLTSKGPVLAREERVGERGRIFVLKKFRTTAWPHDSRITPIGRWLGRSCLLVISRRGRQDKVRRNHALDLQAWRSWTSEISHYPEWRALMVVVIFSGIVVLARALGLI
jgi:Bacterial sugar transferase